MLIHDFVCIDAPAHAVAELVQSGSEWLAPLAVGAYHEGQTLLLRAGPGESGALAKRVRMTVGQSRSREDTVVVPIHWEATGITGLFPVLDAELEFAPVGPDATQLNLWGTYDPPLDGFGVRLDQMIFHRVAEATVRAFLGRVAESVVASTGAQDCLDPVAGGRD